MGKNVVESYHAIRITTLKRRGWLAGGGYPGHLSWSRLGERTGSIDLLTWTSKGEGTMTMYTYSKTEIFSHEVKLVSTPCHYGGVRWWFICPLSRGGIPCGRRVGVLYLGKYTGCRHCHDLVYQSSKDSHKFDRMAIDMGCDPRAFSRMMNQIGK